MNQEQIENRIAKLPQWAQDHITRLNRDVEQRDNAIKALCSTEPSRITMPHPTDWRLEIPVPSDRVTFHFKDGSEIVIQFKKNRRGDELLNVRGCGHRSNLAIGPECCNVVNICPVE